MSSKGCGNRVELKRCELDVNGIVLENHEFALDVFYPEDTCKFPDTVRFTDAQALQIFDQLSRALFGVPATTIMSEYPVPYKLGKKQEHEPSHRRGKNHRHRAPLAQR